ncbi:MAG TPA: GntR family transcriptional regulator [Usitatibacter sp.]|nr:GntR family transcriptional regulator [Usitatibacter sp.]
MDDGVSASERFTPIYFRIQEMIRKRIADGEAVPGDRLPSETELAREYRTTRVTVRHALALLAYEGLIERRTGRGTFVADPGSVVSPIDTLKVHSFEQQVAQRGKRVSYSDARFQLVPAPFEVAQRLALGKAARLYRLDRLRRIDGRIVGVEVRYLPRELGEKVTPAMLEGQSAHEFIGAILGRAIPAIEVTLTAINATRPLAARIGVKPGAALLVRENVFRDASGKVVQYGKSYFRGDIHTEYILGRNPSRIVGD